MRAAPVLALLIAVLPAGCQRGRGASLPPKGYQADALAALRFVQPDKAAADCAAATHEPGAHPIACTLPSGIEVPNPCAWPDADAYAQLLCHELGHWNGWPASHPGATW